MHTTPGPPDPNSADAVPIRSAAARLLEQIQTEERPRRGRLTIYLGAAPGVGKTYAMLQAAHRLRAEGVDVVAGFIETHDRIATAALIGDLECIPRRHIEYRGVALSEMDVDGVLLRRPAVCLVDELAHTNAPGSARPKRWQDVEVLRDAGIDVLATVNIQHLESVHMAVESITGVAVRETIPDSIVDHADQVELIDISPDALRKRLDQGLIYPPERARSALVNFFQAGNLGALRELALRRTAKEVQDQLEQYLSEHGITGGWPSTDRVVVAIDHRPVSRDLLRTAWRLGQGLHADAIMAVTVPGADALSAGCQQHLHENRRLAEDLGIDVHETQAGGSSDRRTVGEALVRFAREHRATHLVLGRSHRSWWRALLGGSVVQQVLRLAPDLDLYIVAERSERPRRRDY